MSKISELGPITGANTRSEDLFVIVNLIQGDDGTKNITRRELVQAIQYEEFNRITITGGTISGVNMFNSTLSGVTINDSIYNRGEINDSELNNVTINTADANDVTMTDSVIYDSAANNVSITNSSFLDGTMARGVGNNMVFTESTIDNSDFSNGTGNNNVFTNSRIDNSEYNNVTIDQGTANGLILTNISIDELILEDAFISNSEIITTTFSNGSIFDTDLDDVDITNSRFSNGEIWDTAIANSTAVSIDITSSTFDSGNISNSSANNLTITQSSATGFNITQGDITQVNITSSDFSDGTGNNNVFTNTTLNTVDVNRGTFANSSFQGTMDDVVAQNMTITSSSTEDMTSANTVMTRSSFDGGIITNSEIKDSTFEKIDLANSTIVDSALVDFDMQINNKFDGPISEDSWFALKNEKTGQVEQFTYKQLNDELGRTVAKSNKVYAAADGDDNNPGSILKPVRTLKRAADIALEMAGGSYDRNDINNAIHISVGPGTYYVDEPIALPDDCALTSTAGQYATVIQKKPGWERTNGILVGSGNYVQGFAYMNFEVDNFDQPEGGFAIAYRPGALLRRSPYIRDSSQLSNFNRLDVEPPLNPFNSKGGILDLGQEFYLEVGHSAQSLFEVDDEVTFSSGASGYISYIDDIDSNHQIYVRNLKGNVEVGDILYAQRGGTGTVEKIGIDDFPNRLVGRGGGCLLADRAVLDTDSLYTYVLCFGFTPRTQNGTGYVAKNGAGVNGIGSLSIFTRQAFFALDGGQMTLNNSGSQFGDISMRARGSTVIIKPAEANQVNLIANTTFADAIDERSGEIIDDMVEYLTSNTVSGGLGYQGYNADKCFRDTGIIVDNVGYDIATNSNYWGRLNGITYRSPISYVVVNEQLTETVGSIEHLKGDINYIFENSNTQVNDRVDASINETLNVLQNGEEFASDIIFADTGVGPRTGAREVVQDNREFIIEEFVDWLDNNPNFFAYDSDKCKRDVSEYILPAVKYDTMLDTNYNSVTAGNAYYFNATRNVIGGQRAETIAAYERLRKTTDDLVQANSAVFAAEAYDKFNEIIDILEQNGTRYTPTNATYNPATGDFVATIGAHDLEVGRYILLMPEGFTFSCDTDGNVLEYSHPRKSDPAFKSAMPITAVTGTTITLNVGSTGYKGVHTFVKALEGSIIELGSEITFSDDSNIPADRRNARKQLQANKDFIQDYMMTWADDEWFFYDSAKCQRDMKSYIVPAVLRDAQLGTNYNSIQNGIAYRQGITKVAVNDQLEETVGAVEHLKLETIDTVSDSIVSHRIEDAYNEIIGIMKTKGRSYTPSTATYDPATGDSVITIENHGLQVGDQIIMATEGLTFSCANTVANTTVEISHPRTTDPAYKKAISISAVTDDTITVNVGDANGYTGAHTFVRSKFNSIQEYASLKESWTPQTATYNPTTGVMEVTIGTHNLAVGDQVILENEGFTFSCVNSVSSAVVNISHPRATDPSFDVPVSITGITDTTITMNVGDANGYTGAHTFVSAVDNAIKSVTFANGRLTATNASYDPVTGVFTATVGSHDLRVGDTVKLDEESFTFSCLDNGNPVEISHPRSTDPAYDTDLVISAVTDNTITMNVGNAGSYTSAHTFVSAEPFAIQVTSVYNGKRTPQDADYDPVSGDMTITIGNHNLPVGKWIQIAPESITFSCANTANAQIVTEISHPRAGDPAYKEPVRITGATATTITVNVGNAGGYTQPHTFVSATNDCIDTNAIYWTDPAKIDSFHTPTTATYAPDTGVMEITLGEDHGFTTDDHIEFKPQSVVFSCWNANNQTQETISHPRIGEPNYQMPLEISAVSNTTITVNVGAAGNGYANNHTFVSAEEGSIIKTRVSREGAIAAKQLQANRKFLQEEVDGWIRDNYFVYKDDKCFRDTGLILDAVRRDIATNSNVNSIFAGLAYRSGNEATDSVINNELTQTVGAIEWLRDEVATNILSGAAEARANTAFDTMISIMQKGKFTPTNATYDPTTGVSVITIGSHNFEVGDEIYIGAESLTFECGSPAVQISHPRYGDPAFNSAVTITAKTDTTITVNVGTAGSYTGAHTFISAKTNAITTFAYRDFGDAYVSDEAYEAKAMLQANKQFIIDNTTDWINANYPGLGYDSAKCERDVGWFIDSVSWDIQHGSNAATVNNSRMYFDNAASVLPFEERPATAAAFDHIAEVAATVVANELVKYETGVFKEMTPSTAAYDPTSGLCTITVVGHGLEVGDRVRLDPESITFSCPDGANTVNISHPRSTDPAYYSDLSIVEATATTFTVDVGDAGGYTGVHTFVSADTGAVKTARTIQSRGEGTGFTPIDGTYDPSTGETVLTIGSHQFSAGDTITLDEESITWSCVNAVSSAVVNISHPRATDPYGGNAPITITGVTDQTVTFNAGNAGGYTGAHTFVSADNDSVRESGRYTPTDATYDPATGIMEVTFDKHTFIPGDRVVIAEESITFECANTSLGANTTLSHPRATDPFFNKEITITGTTATTITMDVGDANGYAGVHTFVSADSGAIIKANGPSAYTATDATYDPTTGISRITLGAHRLEVGDYIIMDEEGLTFSCANTSTGAVTEISHPRVTDPFYNRPVEILAADSTSITINCGAVPNGYAGVHTFVSSTVGAIKKSAKPEVAQEVKDLFRIVANMVRGNDFSELPTIKEPTLSGTNYSASIASQFKELAGSTGKYQKEIIQFIKEEYNGLAYDTELCYRDVGLIVDAVTEDIEYGGNAATVNAANYYFQNAINILPMDQREPTRLAFEHLAEVVEDVITETDVARIFGDSFTPTDATYNPTSGYFTATISGHGLNEGDYVWLEEESITFECANTAANTVVQISHPRSTDPAFETPVKILSVTADTITMDVGGANGYTGAHTFVSADANAIKEIVGNVEIQDKTGVAGGATIAAAAKDLVNTVSAVVDDRLVIPDYAGSLDISEGQRTPRSLPAVDTDTIPLIEPSRTFARKSLQKNRDFIQDEVVAYINDNYFVYDEAKCERDVGYILNAVQRDVATGGNYNSIFAGKVYRSGTTSLDKVLEEQLAETVQAIKYLREDIEPRLTGTALTTATAAFDNIIDIMKYGNDIAPAYNYGTASMNVSSERCAEAMDLNRDFMVAEATAWIAVNYPSLSYDVDKCERDVGYMIDAVSHDIIHGSNVATRDVARIYFENGASVLPQGERAATAALFDRLGEVAQQVALKQTVTKSTGNTETQVTVGFNAAAGAQANELPVLWGIVADIIADDSLINMPTAVEPNAAGTGTGYDYNVSVTTIVNRISPLASTINTYLQDKFDYLDYNQVKCRRDVGYMVDAVSHDIQYGGNSAMWNAAQIYFVNAVNLLPKEQREPTKKAFMHMADVMHKVIRNEDVDLRIGKKFTPSTATYDPETGISVITLGTHKLKVGDYIRIAPEGLTFSCGTPAENISHPRATDPAYGKPLKITAVTATTITVDVGYAKGYTGVHTFVSAKNGAIAEIIGNTNKQDKTTLTARREIAAEARELAQMVANIADDNNPDNLPSRIEPNTDWIKEVFITEKDKVDDKLETLVESMINFITSEYKGISYPKEKCRRDVGIMIDAISHDVQYDTNYATRLCANMYFDNASSVLPFDQRQQTADFYTEMAELVNAVIQEEQAGQDTSNDAGTSIEGEWARDLVNIVGDSIRRNSLDQVPELVEPDTSWVDESKKWAGKEIDRNLDMLADDVTKYIADNFTIIDYSKAKCRRDAGYIIDAISWDLNYGGNMAARWNADFYFWNNELRIPENTREATAQSYRQLGKIISEVVTGSYPGQTIRPEMGDEERAQQAYDAGMIFYNALYFNSPKYLGPLIEPDFTWEDDKNKIFRFSKDILGNNKERLQREVQRFITAEYKFIDLPKTYRDANNFLKVLQNDLRFIDPSQDPQQEGADTASRSFVGALFNIDAQHVFPVFNPPESFTDWRKLRFKGTVASGSARDALTDMKRWDCYIIPTDNNGNRYEGAIWYWNGTAWANAGQNNTDLLYAFYKAWEQMKNYINNNIAPDAAHRTMITELIDNVITDSVLRPNFLVFGSLVESIAHQFNGASAGVNRNALPLNFRNVGAAIGATASVLSENGGRIRWSGADELNNQYFARGLRINGRTGRIEGRPFTSSVRKLARRASNSRAVL